MDESQNSSVEEDKVTSEDVSTWTRDLGEVILVQRARVRSLTAKPLLAMSEKKKQRFQRLNINKQTNLLEQGYQPRSILKGKRESRFTN